MHSIVEIIASVSGADGGQYAKLLIPHVYTKVYKPVIIFNTNNFIKEPTVDGFVVTIPHNQISYTTTIRREYI